MVMARIALSGCAQQARSRRLRKIGIAECISKLYASAY